MSYTAQATDAVRAAEKAVAQLVGDASAAQKWEEAETLISLGKQLRSLVEQAVQPATNASAVANESRTTTLPARAAAVGKKTAYPKFFREGETLVKVAWSKSQRKEYEHKSPRRVADLLVSAVLKAAPRGKRFSMDQILPVRDVETTTDVPEYQVYVAFAWLKSLGLIEQHGRGGYSITDSKPLSEAPVRSWDELESR